MTDNVRAEVIPPNPDIPVVRIFCDYAAEGVWGYPGYYEEYYAWTMKTDKEADLEALESMGHSEDLRHWGRDLALLRELEQWNAQFDYGHLAWTYFLQGWGEPVDLTVFDPDTFTETGLQLAFRMKQHHPDWIVTFDDQVASDRAFYSSDDKAIYADTSFSYIVEIGAKNGMVLIPCEWKDGRPFPKQCSA